MSCQTKLPGGQDRADERLPAKAELQRGGISLKRYLPDGSTRMIWHDALGSRERSRGVLPRRASRVEVITSGPQRGRFFVDFTPLGELTGDGGWYVCLARTFAGYAEAVHAEVRYLLKEWVLAAETQHSHLLLQDDHA